MKETVNQEQSNRAAEQPERTFTQSEMNAIIGERLNREREKYADYEVLKDKAQRFDANGGVGQDRLAEGDGAGERPASRAGQNESGGNGPHHPCPGIPGDGSADEPADRQQQGYLSGTGRSNPCICQDGGRVSPGQG